MYEQKIADVWNRKAEKSKVADRFWLFPEICGHFNRKICGKPLRASAHGLHARIPQLSGGKPFERAVSVGCGLASKEMSLLSQSVVSHFDLFDLAEDRLKSAGAAFELKGLRNRADFHCADAFAAAPKETYDLVYWNSSLHHMPDVFAALQWSREVLRPGGVLAMFEFVGPTRFQWSDLNLDAIKRFRAGLPEELLYRPGRPDPWIVRPTIEEMIERDPSEAMDSGRILPAMQSVFPGAEIIPIGGALYHFGLNGIYPLLTETHKWVYDQALLVDDLLTSQGENHFAVAFGQKS
jgi:SAM-dependent methyltransferase